MENVLHRSQTSTTKSADLQSVCLNFLLFEIKDFFFRAPLRVTSDEIQRSHFPSSFIVRISRMRFKLDAEGWGGLVLSTRHLFRSIKPILFAFLKSKWPKGWLPESPFNTNRNVPNGPSEEMFQMGLEDDKKITRRIYRLLNFRFEGYLQSGVLDGTPLCK